MMKKLWIDPSYDEEQMSVYDSVYGTVLDSDAKGVYVLLENGEIAFARFAKLARGVRVLCTVLDRPERQAHRNVSIDAVYGDDREEYACEPMAV